MTTLDQIRAIGFIGLGIMGFPMAVNLSRQTPSQTLFHIHDISPQAMKDFERATGNKAIECRSAKAVAEQCDIVFTMVPEGSHVRAVYLTEETGILAADLTNKILVDCSTIDTATSIAVGTAIHQQYPSARFYDAPVSGGSLGAANASLTFMLGCVEDDDNFVLLKELLGMMGRSIFACGGPSLGLTAKLCNNYCSGLIALATAEAMNIGMRSGLDAKVLAGIFSTGTAQSTINDKWNPVPGVCPSAPASHGYQGGFKVELMRKDFQLAVDAAHRVGATLTLGESGLRTYTEASEDARCRGLDSRVVYRYIGGREDWNVAD